jgi:NADPH2:quinone reductase
MAEKAVGSAVNCWKIPDMMRFDDAAALLMTYGTSHHALKDRAQLHAGETLLVLGAGGSDRCVLGEFANRLPEALARLEARDAGGKLVVMVGQELPLR